MDGISRRYKRKRIPFYFERVDLGNGRGVYYFVGEYLTLHGFSIRKFELRSNMGVASQEPFQGNAFAFAN